jgi:hypothetical protein
MLTVIKFLAIASSSTFGVIGIIHDFKDKETGKITKWGLVAIYGVLFSGITAGVIQLIEHQKSIDESKKANITLSENIERQKKIISDSQEALTELRGIQEKTGAILSGSEVLQNKFEENLSTQKVISMKQENILKRSEYAAYPIIKDEFSFHIQLRYDLDDFPDYANKLKSFFNEFMSKIDEHHYDAAVVSSKDDNNKVEYKWSYNKNKEPELISATLEGDSPLITRSANSFYYLGDSYPMGLSFTINQSGRSSFKSVADIEFEINYGNARSISHLLATASFIPSSVNRKEAIVSKPSSSMRLKAKFISIGGGAPEFILSLRSTDYSIVKNTGRIYSLLQLDSTDIILQPNQVINNFNDSHVVPRVEFLEIGFRDESLMPIRWYSDSIYLLDKGITPQYKINPQNNKIRELIMGEADYIHTDFSSGRMSISNEGVTIEN